MSIDRYDPIRILGEGSFGKVYLMRDKVKRNFVCVKIIKIKNIPKKEREATKVEVDLLKRLHHPNIVRYIDSFLSKNNESLCICMEYCDGGDLASQIKAARRNLFSESKILHWFVQLALGLHYMHSNKVLHRDLKTQNVFLLGNGRLVLGDLGISKVLDGTMDFAQTCIGTPYYMSPEIFKNKPYSYKSDVWALGCVLYELTTLNHAFDANSLNGLATKIVKGKYPPISPKYSKNLSELIAQMLMLNPQQRPDLDQILRKPFIKKHVVNFFVDIAARPSASIGEGTMIFKAAAGGQASGSVMTDSNMISLRNQLQSLDMMGAVQDALQPKAAPQDDEQAIKLAREQASALKREQEHKKMVEAALEKLRVERENRAKQRDVGVNRVQQPQQSSRAAPSQGPAPAPIRRDDPQKRPVPVPAQIPQQQSAQPRPSGAVVDGARRIPQRSDDNVQGRRRSYGEDRDRIIERERRAAEEREKKIAEDRKKIADQEERRRLQEQQEERRRISEQEAARVRVAEDRRREEVRAEARAREEARLREEAKQREEQAERMRMEQVREKAEQAARAKREALREKEKERQRLEIEQLKRDKLELDRRTQEKERQREERRAQERVRVDAARRDQFDVMQEKLDYMNDQINQISKLDLRRAEEKNEDNISARERAYISRRQEKAAKEEAERLEALREAEIENRRIRVENRNKQFAADGYPSGKGRVSDPYGDEQPGYEFDAIGRSKPKARGMDADELQDRLDEATKGRSRFEEPKTSARGSDTTNSSKSQVAQKQGSLAGFGSDSGEEEDDDWEKGEVNAEEEDEDLHRREEELQAELNFATMRVEELKRTLQETKSFLGPRLPTRGQPQPTAAPIKKEPTYEDEEFEDDDELFNSDGDYEDSGDENRSRAKGRGSDSERLDGADSTLRRIRVPESAVPSSAYGGLQDHPSPSGKLSDRIERLRQRCMEALGRDAFIDAYNFLRQHEQESQGYDNGRDMNDDDYEAKKLAKIRSILGEAKAHYMSLIDQLIFMEGAERDY